MNNTSSSKHVVVIVLGDIGRSPRMQYHALSLLEHKYRVTLVGYAGEDLIPQLSLSKWGAHLRVIRMNTPRFENIHIKPVRLMLRMLALIIALFDALFRKSAAVPVHVVLAQNPPSIPLLFMCWLFVNSRISFSNPFCNKRPAFIIDWHNLGFSMFDLPDSHPITIIARSYEKAMASLSDANFCVSSAMEKWLYVNFNISCKVLRDRPPDFFQSTSIYEQHECLLKLKPIFRPCAEKFRIDVSRENETICTYIAPNGEMTLRSESDSPRIIVSSTSWTPDEDFSVMLDALVLLENRIENIQAGFDKPKLLVVVTGKGPQKLYYEAKIYELIKSLKHIFVMTMWLEAFDYPKLIGFSDFGLSLHTSTSGIDLPMKVLDFFGGELPVCARRFGCIDELVQHGSNGLVFDTSEELADQMFQLLTDKALLRSLKDGVRGMKRWRENWDEHVDVLVKSLATQHPNVSIIVRAFQTFIIIGLALFLVKLL